MTIAEETSLGAHEIVELLGGGGQLLISRITGHLGSRTPFPGECVNRVLTMGQIVPSARSGAQSTVQKQICGKAGAVK